MHKVFQELNMYQFSLLVVNPTHSFLCFDEYNNFRQFKVSYKDTRTVFLSTLIRFHTSFGGSK